MLTRNVERLREAESVLRCAIIDLMCLKESPSVLSEEAREQMLRRTATLSLLASGLEDQAAELVPGSSSVR